MTLEKFLRERRAFRTCLKKKSQDQGQGHRNEHENMYAMHVFRHVQMGYHSLLILSDMLFLGVIDLVQVKRGACNKRAKRYC